MEQTTMTDTLDARREEVAYYDTNIAMCQALLRDLPHDWPDHLTHLRDHPDRHAAAAQLDLADVPLYARLVLRDELEARLRAETYERTKAAAILSHLEATHG